MAELAQIEGYYPSVVMPKALELGPQIQDTFGRAWCAGVPIAFGTIEDGPKVQRLASSLQGVAGGHPSRGGRHVHEAGKSRHLTGGEDGRGGGSHPGVHPDEALVVRLHPGLLEPQLPGVRSATRGHQDSSSPGIGGIQGEVPVAITTRSHRHVGVRPLDLSVGVRSLWR